MCPTFGPASSAGVPQTDAIIRLRNINGTISAGRSLLGDNDVIHDNFVGQLYLDPKYDRDTSRLVFCPFGTTNFINWHRLASTGTYRSLRYGWTSNFMYVLLKSCSDLADSHNATATLYVIAPSKLGSWKTRVNYGKSKEKKEPVVPPEDFGMAIELLVAKYVSYWSIISIGFYKYTSAFNSTASFDSLSDTEIKHALSLRPAPTVAGNPDNVFTDITMDAVDSAEFVEVNGLTFMQDLFRIKALLPPLPTSGAKSFLDPKYLANLFLWFRYGAEPTIRDIQSLAESAKRGANECLRYTKVKTAYRTLRAGKTDNVDTPLGICHREYHVKIRYSHFDNKVMNIIQDLNSLGVFPTWERAWDMVPYSFVVDWFKPIGNLLHKLDAYTEYQYFDIWGVTKSRKHYVDYSQNSFSILGITLIGNYRRSIYYRSVQDYLDLPSLNLSPSKSFSNWAEAVALLVQRKRN